MIPRAKISKGGKIVIPAFFRKKLNLKDGEEVMLEIQDEHLVITSLRHKLESARQTVNRYHSTKESLVDVLFEMRREEAKHEH
ncbi:hypothetical protein IM40_11425 (plasmid) [Candidatus Paracaedimonas acanthamoebae]|nr:hypothetical protein IM40_11425 [Candidatus Paracaedimonas acanthamoebae]